MLKPRKLFVLFALLPLSACVGGPTDPGGTSVTILRPQDFRNGMVDVKLEHLMPDETVAVIPVNAEQALNPDGFSYSLEVNGINPVGTNPRITTQSESTTRDTRERWLEQFYVERSAQVRQLQAAGQPSLFEQPERFRPQAQSFNKCGAPYEIGKTCTYWVTDPNSTSSTGQSKITTTLRYISPNAYWFIQNEDIGSLSTDDLAALAQKYERELLPSNRRYFGNPQDVDRNGKLKVVISNIVGKYAYGYVDYLDFFSDEITMGVYGQHSNEGDIFYAASPNSPAGGTRDQFINVGLPGTLVHELKHLIGGGIRIANERPLEHAWIEEAAAVAAEELSGYGSQVSDYARSQSRFGLATPQNLRIVYSDNDRLSGPYENGSIYGYNFLFLWRIAERVGHDRFWNTWQNGSDVSVANLERASGMSMPEMMLDFAQTLLFDHTGLKASADYKSLNLRDGEWSPLGYRSLETTRDTARSMAFYLGSGQGRDATIRLSTQHHRPYLIVARFKGTYPVGPSRWITGTVRVPEGFGVNGTMITLCKLVNGTCSPQSVARQILVHENGREFAYSVLRLPEGQYNIEAYQDTNRDGIVSVGDLYGCFGGGACAAVTPPTTSADVSLSPLLGIDLTRMSMTSTR